MATIHRTPLPGRHRPLFVPALGLLLLVAGALLVTGTILSLGLVLIPVLLIGIAVFGAWQHRRARPLGPTDAVVPDDSASSATEKTI